MRDMFSKRWRKKDGRPCHDGDCHFWSEDLCTCGLIHHVMWDPPEDAGWHWEERARHEKQLSRLPSPLPYVPPTKEEMEERTKLVEELFGKDAADYCREKEADSGSNEENSC